MFEQSVRIVRILTGVQYVWSGINWWIKILPFPSMYDIDTFQHKHVVALAMIKTGWMFQMSKAIELLTGLALLADVLVPFMLVVSMPVAVTTFLLDAFIFNEIYGWLMGTVPGNVAWAKFLDMMFFGGVLLISQGYLIFAYFDCYRPMLGLSPKPRWPIAADAGHPLARGSLKTLFILMGVISLVLGAVCTVWYLGMTRQWLIPWSSLRVFAPH